MNGDAMAANDSTLPLRNLVLLPAVTAPGNAGNETPVTEPLPATATGGETGPATGPVAMTAPERARLAVTHWGGTAAKGAGQMWLHPGRLVHSLCTGKPASLAEHRAYIKSREWVPPELDGKAAAFLAVTGIAYHLVIARPLKTAALIVSASADRPLRLAGLAAFLSVAFFLLAHYL